MTLDERVPVNPNTADQETLSLLPGVGPVLAERIIAARPYENLQDLTRVRGVGADTVEPWGDLLTFSSETDEVSFEAKVQPVSAADVHAEPSMEVEEVESWPSEEATEEKEGTEMEPNAAAGPETRPLETERLDSERFVADRLAAKEEPGAGPNVPEEPSEEVEEEEPGPSEAEPQEALPPLPEAVPEEEPERPKRPVTRRYVGCLVIASGLLALALALALSLGILAQLNDNRLQYASPAEVNQLALRVEGLETRAESLAQDVEGLRTRLSNVEAIGERMQAVEGAVDTLQTDLDAVSERLSGAEEATAELSTQIEAIESNLSTVSDQLEELQSDVSSLQAQSGQFQAFLEGLQALIDSLFQPGEQ